ncbi:hypothetical protein AB0M23_20695 [Streptomyces sp. NPDC052077]|uniref:hypothetical protein n=1 Tax=Streptomyces sp. NPDC052077 TaxID=3154757 RepID=UPI003419E274
MTGRTATTRTAPPREGGAAVLPAAVCRAAAALVVLLLFLVVLVLPWAGDLGMHAATVERLRHGLTRPGSPLVDADVPSPYYSPWTVLLGLLARVTGWQVFTVLRIGAVAGLALLVTGVWRYVRTLSDRPSAPPLALLCLVLLWGTAPVDWSGFAGLHSLALTAAYPSVLALGLAFHFWAWLTRAVREPPGWAAWAGLGVLWAVIVLCHQFSGVVASLGALATLVAARCGRPVWARAAAGLAAGLAVLWAWPYYDVFALLGTDGLEAAHRSLYRDLAGRYWLVLVGVAALALRLRRDRRDVLVVFFALGAAVFAAGGLSGHWSWGRALPAALVPAQLAAALLAAEAGHRWWSRRGREPAGAPAVAVGAVAAALAVGAWAQSGTVGYVTGPEALPPTVREKYREPWRGYGWITPWVRYGDVVMARTGAARQIPAYGAYTVAPGYPDVFLPDAPERTEAVRRYFAPGTAAGTRRAVERAYAVRWVVDRGGLRGAEGLREVARGPDGEVLYRVPGGR